MSCFQEVIEEKAQKWLIQKKATSVCKLCVRLEAKVRNKGKSVKDECSVGVDKFVVVVASFKLEVFSLMLEA